LKSLAVTRKRILIVEDEPSVAMYLEDMVSDIIPSVIVLKSSVASTKKVIDEPFDFALLDVDVTNGKTFDLARMLAERQVPFAFVSGSPKSELPGELQHAAFVQKPFPPSELERLLLHLL
jgi:DNA-binding response OmpR family regulator